MNINTKILNARDKKDAKFLRKKTAKFDFKKHTKSEITKLVSQMKAIMLSANGQGLAANQIGLNSSVFVAQVDGKFYAVFNPTITKATEEKDTWQGEGCLSLPGVTAPTYSPAKLTLEGQDKNGKKLKIKAWGMLALTFQHEVDHLNGKLFIDRRVVNS
ncbi:MAG: peptide deformylase [Candidatus Colwellbacteria bacterium]|nr:peptide deformylase [Candidatus Colwellbacteria bacterium]